MTVTLALLALAATLVVPRLAARGRCGLPAVAEAAAERLTAGRWAAIVEGRPVQVSLDALAPDLQVREEVPGSAPAMVPRGIGFAPLPAALPRTIVLTDAAGRAARITIPAGLGPLGIVVEDRS